MTPRFANLRRGHLMRRPGLIARIALPLAIAALIGLSAAWIYTVMEAIPDLHGQAEVWGRG